MVGTKACRGWRGWVSEAEVVAATRNDRASLELGEAMVGVLGVGRMEREGRMVERLVAAKQERNYAGREIGVE